MPKKVKPVRINEQDLADLQLLADQDPRKEATVSSLIQRAIRELLDREKAIREESLKRAVETVQGIERGSRSYRPREKKT
jgi:Arc/MetJ-type ribon-helix-helix transcriptional regulator